MKLGRQHRSHEAAVKISIRGSQTPFPDMLLVPVQKLHVIAINCWKGGTSLRSSFHLHQHRLQLTQNSISGAWRTPGSTPCLFSTQQQGCMICIQQIPSVVQSAQLVAQEQASHSCRAGRATAAFWMQTQLETVGFGCDRQAAQRGMQIASGTATAAALLLCYRRDAYLCHISDFGTT